MERLKPQPLPERILGEVTCFALEHGIKLDIEGKENLIQTRKHLREGGSVIFYFNHCSMIDPAILAEILKENIGREIKDWVAPGSFKHLDPKRSILGPIESWVMQGFAHKKGFELCPVIQFYDEESYPQRLVTKINTGFARRARNALRSPGGILLIAPEGTRSPDNQLLEAQRGVEWFLEQGKNTAAQPIAFIGSKLPHSLITKPRVIIGPIYPREKICNFAENRGFEVRDALMVLLAQLLPQEYRGVYAQYFF